MHPLTGHWVTSFYSVEKKCVYVYDSLQSPEQYHEVKKQISVIYSEYHAANLKYVSVQQQNQQPVCGVMAIAFAVSIYFDKNPEYIRFDLTMLHTHLRNCLLSGTVAMYPVIQCVSLPEVNSPTNINLEKRHSERINRRLAQVSTWTPLLDKYFSSQTSLSSRAAARQRKVQNKRTNEENKINKTSDKLRKQNQQSARGKMQVEMEKQSNRKRMQNYRSNRSKEKVESDREKNRQGINTLRKNKILDATEADKQHNRKHMRLVRCQRSPTTKRQI